MRWRWIVLALLVAGSLFVVWQRTGLWPFGPRHVQVLSHDGTPVWGAVLYLQRPGEERPDFTGVANSSDGWIEIPRAEIRDGAIMRAVGPACGIVAGDLPSGFELRLPPGKRVKLSVPGDFPLPRPPMFLDFRFTPVGEARGWDVALEDAVAPPDYWSRSEMDRAPGSVRHHLDAAKRSIDLLFPRAGKWHVHWSVMRYEGAMGSGHGPAEPIEIDIADDATELVLPLTREQMLAHVR